MDRKTLTVAEAGQVLGIGRSAAYEAVKTGELPTIRIGRRLLVPIVLLEAMLNGSAAASRRETTISVIVACLISVTTISPVGLPKPISPPEAKYALSASHLDDKRTGIAKSEGDEVLHVA